MYFILLGIFTFEMNIVCMGILEKYKMYYEVVFVQSGQRFLYWSSQLAVHNNIIIVGVN